MLNDTTYRQWTEIFNPDGGSYYEGDWSTGSTMKFLGPSKNGEAGGMYSRVKENRPYEFVSVEHLGEIVQGEQKPWPGDPNMTIFENYYFEEVDGSTKVKIEMDTNEEFKKMFEETWPTALEKVKELAEK